MVDDGGRFNPTSAKNVVLTCVLDALFEEKKKMFGFEQLDFNLSSIKGDNIANVLRDAVIILFFAVFLLVIGFVLVGYMLLRSIDKLWQTYMAKPPPMGKLSPRTYTLVCYSRPSSFLQKETRSSTPLRATPRSDPAATDI